MGLQAGRRRRHRSADRPRRRSARIEVANHPTGAPYVLAEGAPPGLEVSLTDRAGWAVCLVGTAMGRLGCDLELVEPRSAGFVADFLTALERDWVACAARQRTGTPPRT